MEQLVILIIIGLISLVNWVMQKAAEKRELARMKRESEQTGRRNIYTQPVPTAAPRRTIEPRPAQDPFKELMDALGLPADEVLPPPVDRRFNEPPFYEEEEFASIEEPAPPPLPAKEPVVVRQVPQRPSPPDRKTRELASAFASVESSGESTWRGTKLRQLLASRDSQRQAVVLAEIFGTPRGLSPAGSITGRD